MQLAFDKRLIEGYKSASQKIRVLTEHWVDKEIYCPNCGRVEINKFENSRPVADFYCKNCREEYELKSKQNSVGTKVVDGAYRTMIERLTSSHNPNFFLLSYNPLNLEVIDFFVIPKHFFVPEMIEKRKPLSPSTERPDWVGCNILMNFIPETGKIFFVRDRHIEPKQKVLSQWKRTLFLRDEKEVSAKGWLLDIMRCVEKVGKGEFTLDDVYLLEKELGRLHPDNRHIKDKIRQQLQVLRDKNYLEFIAKGRYRLTS